MIIFGGLPPSTRWPPPNASRILRLPLSLFAYVLLPLLASSVARSLLASAVRRVSFSLCGASFPDFSPHVLSPPVSLETPPSPVAASLRITSPSPNFSTFAPPIQLLLFLLFRPLTFGCNLSWPENRRVFSINSNRPDWKPPGPLGAGGSRLFLVSLDLGAVWNFLLSAASLLNLPRGEQKKFGRAFAVYLMWIFVTFDSGIASIPVSE